MFIYCSKLIDTFFRTGFFVFSNNFYFFASVGVSGFHMYILLHSGPFPPPDNLSGSALIKKSRQIQSQLNWTCRLCKTICNCNIWLTVWAFLYFYDISIFNTISLYKIVHYSLSYSGFSVFPVPRSKATTTVTLCTSIFSLWFLPILLKPKNSTKCVNSRISRYLSFVVPPPSPHAQSSQIDQPGILF